MKSCILILLSLFVILVVVAQPVKKLIDNANTNITDYEVSRSSRSLSFPRRHCSIFHYYDEEEGRCMAAVGGGKALYIDRTKSCGIDVLKPHCSNPRYYYICKKGKTILAQCPNNRHFEALLQKCIFVPHFEYVSVIVQPNSDASQMVQLPDCKEAGSFAVPGDCSLFYTCMAFEIHQTFYRCPKYMAYDPEAEMCTPSSTCTKSELYFSCSTTIKGENMTLEEAGKLPPLSKSFTVHQSGSSVSCATMYTTGDETTTMNIRETMEDKTTIRNKGDEDNDDGNLKLTTAAHTKPSGYTDNKDIASTTERAPEKSRSENVDDSATYSTTTNTYKTETNTPAKENQGTSTPRGFSKEFSTTETTKITEPLITKTTTAINTGSTTAAITEIATAATIETTTSAITETATAAVTESTTAAITEITTAATTETHTAATTETTTAAITETTTAATTTAVTESTTAAITETDTAAVTETTTAATTAAIIETTTAVTTETATAAIIETTTAATTAAITESTTAATTDTTTAATVETTTAAITETATAATIETTTAAITETATAANTETATAATVETTTAAITETATAANTETATAATVKTTTAAITETATAANTKTATAANTETATAATVKTTTAATTEATTAAITETATAAIATTTISNNATTANGARKETSESWTIVTITEEPIFSHSTAATKDDFSEGQSTPRSDFSDNAEVETQANTEASSSKSASTNIMNDVPLSTEKSSGELFPEVMITPGGIIGEAEVEVITETVKEEPLLETVTSRGCSLDDQPSKSILNNLIPSTSEEPERNDTLPNIVNESASYESTSTLNDAPRSVTEDPDNLHRDTTTDPTNLASIDPKGNDKVTTQLSVEDETTASSISVNEDAISGSTQTSNDVASSLPEEPNNSHHVTILDPASLASSDPEENNNTDIMKLSAEDETTDLPTINQDPVYGSTATLSDAPPNEETDNLPKDTATDPTNLVSIDPEQNDNEVTTQLSVEDKTTAWSISVNEDAISGSTQTSNDASTSLPEEPNNSHHVTVLDPASLASSDPEEKNNTDITKLSAEDETTDLPTINQDPVYGFTATLSDAPPNEETDNLPKDTTTDPTNLVSIDPEENDIEVATQLSVIDETTAFPISVNEDAINISTETSNNTPPNLTEEPNNLGRDEIVDPRSMENNDENNSSGSNVPKTEKIVTDSYDFAFSSSTDAANYFDTVTATSAAESIGEIRKTTPGKEQIKENVAKPLINYVLSSTPGLMSNANGDSFVGNNKPTSSASSTSESISSVNNPALHKNTQNDPSTRLNIPEVNTVTAIRNELSNRVRPTISLEELLANCAARASAANNEKTTKEVDLTNNGEDSNSFHEYLHSWITDKKKAFGHSVAVAKEESATAPKLIHSGKTISKNVALPIASAVLNVTDKFERHIKNILSQLILR